MKETTKMSRAFGQIERMYNSINADKFNNVLPVPIITIQSMKGTWGHCTRAKVWRKKDGEAYEMNIAAEVADACLEEIIDTLIHEMIHLYCRENNIQETSRGGTYHNHIFKELAEEKGLQTIKTEKSGWNTIGTGNDKLIEYALSKGWNELKISRSSSLTRYSDLPATGISQIAGTTTGGKKPSSTRKLQCPKCKCSCRATKSIRIMCMDCGLQMLEV